MPDVLDWLLKNNATLQRYIWIGEVRWRVVLHNGHGQISSGKTPREAFELAVAVWGE